MRKFYFYYPPFCMFYHSYKVTYNFRECEKNLRISEAPVNVKPQLLACD